MILCSFCQFRNEDGSLFCEQCKSDLGLVEAQPVQVAEAAVMAVPVMPEAAVAHEAVAAMSYETILPSASVAVVEDVPPPVAAVVPLDADLEVVEDAPAPMPEAVAALVMETFPTESAPMATEHLVAAAAPTAEAIVLPDVVSPPPAAPPVEVVAPPAPLLPVAAVAAEPVAEVASPSAAPPPPADTAVASQPKLIVTRGLRIGIEYTVYEGHNFIGRMDEKPVDIDLEDQESAEKVYSSRQHALVTYENGQLLIEDLNSSNGTFVNRNRIYPGQSKPLQTGDVIQIGTVQMRVKL